MGLQMAAADFPDLDLLTVGLTAVLPGHATGGITVLHREPASHASTFPAEVVTCRCGDNREVRLYCKYGTDCGNEAHGHRGGVAYEANVYQRVLQPVKVSVAPFHGAYRENGSGRIWLILDYLDNNLRVSKVPDTNAMLKPAHWIGRFHGIQESRLSAVRSTLKTYDRDYYLGWARRTALFANCWHRSFPWLTDLCERFETLLDDLVAVPPTVIHGEYYPQNILVRDGVILPVDWESAAIAAGEIDLACLTENWPTDTARACEAEYVRARWPVGAPSNFGYRLDLARLYLFFRWLGDRPERTAHEGSLVYLKNLEPLVKRLELIEER